MRLTEKEQQTIKSVIKHYVPTAEIYLFGSRVDDTKRGGDIDILVIDEQKIMNERETIWKITSKLEEMLGEQKFDILYQEKEHLTTFGQLALLESVSL